MKHHPPKILFVIKEQLGYNGSAVPSKGLFNSAQFVVNALRLVGIECALVEVIDANDIDREVTRYRPTHCIIEALWATPEKLNELQRLHPRVRFVVRIHSNVPFLASEGVALDWLQRYDVPVAFNAGEAMRALALVIKNAPIYLPNIYAPGAEPSQKKLDTTGHNLWVGCLGAIRPLKNHLQQALAAMHYAELTDRNLIFHVNDRVEQGGEPVLKNLRALFKNSRHRLVEHAWLPKHEDVLHIVASFDISMHVSFTETFNIASADAVWCGVPIVVSREVKWAPRKFGAKPNHLKDIVATMLEAEHAGRHGTRMNLHALQTHNTIALDEWRSFLQANRTGESL